MTKQITQGLGGVTLAVIVAAAALLLFASSAFAAGTLSGDTQTVAPLGAATVTITGAAATGGIGNWTIDVTVDAAKLGTATCTAVNAAGDCSVLTGNVVRFAGAAGSEAGLAGTQTFGTISVTATSALAAGDCSTLTITTSKFQDGLGADLNPTITNGKVCVAAATNSPSPSPIASASASPTATVKALPSTGGPVGDSSSISLAWLLGAAGLIVVAGGAWTLARARREEN